MTPEPRPVGQLQGARRLDGTGRAQHQCRPPPLDFNSSIVCQDQAHALDTVPPAPLIVFTLYLYCRVSGYGMPLRPKGLSNNGILLGKSIALLKIKDLRAR